MVARGWGRIVNISGLGARSTGSAVGSIRNVAVAALTKNLADELGPSGINVTVVHPGLTRTEATPGVVSRLAATRGVPAEEVEASLGTNNSIRRLVDADEVAAVVAFLASPLSSAVTGDAVACGGGQAGVIYY
jgi:NAD(P)-dependent dehydrogenase (short-subunit alcohol dehydrogenase family)